MTAMPNAKPSLPSTSEEYLKLPYARVIIPEDNGMFRAEIMEFPGCLAIGETAAIAFEKLEVVAESWVDAALEQGQSIPPPIENRGFSGRLVLRLSRGLHRQASQMAERESVSLNQFIVTAVALHVGEKAAPKATASWLVNCAVMMQPNSLNLVITNLADANQAAFLNQGTGVAAFHNLTPRLSDPVVVKNG
jgi:antitoxin HicB